MLSQLKKRKAGWQRHLTNQHSPLAVPSNFKDYRSCRGCAGAGAGVGLGNGVVTR